MRPLSIELAVIATRKGSRASTTLRLPLVPSIQLRRWKSVPRRTSSSAASANVIESEIILSVDVQRLPGRAYSPSARVRAVSPVHLVQCLSHQRARVLEAGRAYCGDFTLPARHRLFCVRLV